MKKDDYMEFTKTFKTASGYCHIFLDKIVLSPHQNPDEPVEEKQHHFIFVIIYSLLFVLLLGAAIKGLFAEFYYWASVCLIASLYFLRRSIFVANNANSSIINRSNIVNIEYYQSIYAVQAPQFLIEVKNGKLPAKKIYIILGNRYTNDKNNQEIQKAIEIMDEEFG